MAKRKRLTSAQPDYLEAAPETKGLFPMGVARTRPPIAQVAGDGAAAAALGELTEMVTQARAEGRLIQVLSLAEVALDHLVRDRLPAEDQGEDLGDLISSLRARGQQTPIEVVDRGAKALPRYGLISGWRRMAALGHLAAQDPAFDRVLALVRAPDTAAEAYLAMVEENEIRVGLSYYERARIVVKACAEGVYPTPKAALQGLFANVSRAKRSKIKSFMTVVEALDGVLRYPTALGERLGLALAKHLEDPTARAALRARLTAAPAPDAETERAQLNGALTAAAPESPAPESPGPDAQAPAPPNPDPVSNATSAPAMAPVDVAFDEGRITLTGPGVDHDLHRALVVWLARRDQG